MSFFSLSSTEAGGVEAGGATAGSGCPGSFGSAPAGPLIGAGVPAGLDERMVPPPTGPDPEGKPSPPTPPGAPGMPPAPLRPAGPGTLEPGVPGPYPPA